MLTVFIRGIFLYFLVIFAVRLMGKRQLGELAPSELVITILISNIATLAMEDVSVPLFTGIIPILTLVCLDVFASYASLKSRRIRHILSGKPKVIISGGVIDQKQLRALRYTVDDLMSALRTQGIFDVTEVQYAVVETTGAVSALLKADCLPLTPKTAASPDTPSDPPQTVISDGDFIKTAAEQLGIAEEDILKELKRRHLEAGGVFLCTADSSGKLKIIAKKGDKK